ncbi:MAG: hypothetical protein PHD74_06970 [Candidatus Krumholzibacteria bacterium]|nr:hypothetical protein [Candidatus Krumholzibacteria bacterium]
MRKVLVLFLVLLCAAPSCKRGGADKKNEFPYSRRFESGPVSFRVSLSDSSVSIAKRVNMLLETRAQKGYSAELPKFGDKLSEFGIVDYRNYQNELAPDGSVVTKRLYELEPFLSGEYKIPPMEIAFYQEGDSTRHTLESDTIIVNVTSLLPKDKASLNINDVAPPAKFPFGWRNILIVVGCVAGAAAAFLIFWKRRRIKEKIVPKLPAHEIAYRKLEALLARKLVEQKLYREFTAEVSDILRAYIEDRFGLKAPERTTEEFLVEVSPALPVDAQKKDILRSFLVHCDLVKFAALEPSVADVERTFATCRDFLEATKVREEVKADAAEAASAPTRKSA